MNGFLTVERVWQSAYVQQTILRDEKGAVKKIINSPLQQPKKKDKEYVLNGKKYLLVWKE